jgi:tetracycline repressor-like protein
VAEFILALLDSSEGRRTVTGLIRAAASEEAAAATIRELVAQRLLLPLASRVGRDRPELRASLVASQIVGLAMARHVVGLTPLTTASHAELIAALAPVFDHYPTDQLDPEQAAAGVAGGRRAVGRGSRAGRRRRLHGIRASRICSPSVHPPRGCRPPVVRSLGPVRVRRR